MNDSINGFLDLLQAGGGVELEGIFLTMIVSFFLSLVISSVYTKTHSGDHYSQNFTHMMVIITVATGVIIPVIGSNIARAFSLAGALSIIRFRSSITDPRDVAFIFFSMGVGLTCGAGHYLQAGTFTLLLGSVIWFLRATNFGSRKSRIKILHVSIPEDVDYEHLLDDILKKHCDLFRVMEVKTVNLGTIFELVYQIRLKDSAHEKAMIDEIRTRNGNLRISLSLDAE